MKRLIVPLLAALALPTAVRAESVWLILRTTAKGAKGGVALEKIEMESLSQCEEQAHKVFKKLKQEKFMDQNYVCIVGK